MNDEICEKCGCPVHPCLPCEEVVLLNGNHTDDTYKDLLKLILREGKRKTNRTGVDTIGVFGAQAKFAVDLDAFPILTTKKVWFKGIVHELLWFLRGSTNIKYLVDNDVHIWDEWAYKQYTDAFTKSVQLHAGTTIGNTCYTQDEFIKGIKQGVPDLMKYADLGQGTYGSMWRAFPYADTWSDGYYTELACVDQIQKVIEKLKTNPDDRRMIVSAWHPYWVDHCALPPCHCLFQFNTEELTLEERLNVYMNAEPGKYRLLPKYLGSTEMEATKAYDDIKVPKRRLNLLMYQRSCDTFLGVPFNITSYSLLLALVAHCVNMEPGVFTHTYGDLHIYTNHLDQVNEQLSRTPMKLPRLRLNPTKKDLMVFEYSDIELIDYKSHPAIKAPIAV